MTENVTGRGRSGWNGFKMSRVGSGGVGSGPDVSKCDRSNRVGPGRGDKVLKMPSVGRVSSENVEQNLLVGSGHDPQDLQVIWRVDRPGPASAFSLPHGLASWVLREDPALKNLAACCPKVYVVPTRFWYHIQTFTHSQVQASMSIANPCFPPDRPHYKHQ